MKTAFAAAVAALLATGVAAHASAYTEFNAGLEEQGRNDELAIRHFSAALSDSQLLTNLRPVALLDRATAYERQGKFDLAESDLTASAALHPTFGAYVMRALIYQMKSEHDLALQDAAAAIAIRPDLTAGYQLRGLLLADIDRFEEAVGELTIALSLTPDDALLYEYRSNYYLYKGDYSSAMADADKAIEITNGAPASYAPKVAIFEVEEHFDEALDSIEKALGQSQNNLLWLMKKGIIQWEDHKFDDAIATFALTTKIAPSLAYPSLWLSLVRAEAHVVDTDANDRALKIDLKKWPGPVVKLYQGSSQPDAVMAAAGENQMLRKGQICEANFYIAQWQRSRGNLTDAKARLQAVMANCPYSFVERPAAVIELKAMQ